MSDFLLVFVDGGDADHSDDCCGDGGGGVDDVDVDHNDDCCDDGSCGGGDNVDDCNDNNNEIFAECNLKHKNRAWHVAQRMKHSPMLRHYKNGNNHDYKQFNHTRS